MKPCGVLRVEPQSDYDLTLNGWVWGKSLSGICELFGTKACEDERREFGKDSLVIIMVNE